MNGYLDRNGSAIMTAPYTLSLVLLVLLWQLFVMYLSGECFTSGDGLGAGEMQDLQTERVGDVTHCRLGGSAEQFAICLHHFGNHPLPQ